MYKAFKTSASYFGNKPPDKEFYIKDADRIKNILNLAFDEGRIDGTKMRDTWFPLKSNAHVFISHSHKDVDAAIRLSNWLRSELGIQSFIDSAVWLQADDLLREIDNKFCYNEQSETYSYQKRNGTTSHVHMMLATALSLMMDSCECAFFIDSPNSVSRSEAVETTGSPWIMYELNLMSLIRIKPLSRQILFSENAKKDLELRANASIDIDYDINLSHLKHISADDFNSWNSKSPKLSGAHALDYLYAL